ncbi:MAG: hypothetical protein M1819_001129 [Sarea resinae]|nr:MAG: hypothetical protein M1819_001129 [Sarea resinae]
MWICNLASKIVGVLAVFGDHEDRNATELSAISKHVETPSLLSALPKSSILKDLKGLKVPNPYDLLNNSDASHGAPKTVLFTERNQPAKAVFAHHMVGNVYAADAQTDIDDAIGIGLDGFALNIGDPTQPFVQESLGIMFDYAASNGFKLFVSMDVWASGASGKGPKDYVPLLQEFPGAEAWYHGPNGLPLLSTFSDGGLTSKEWGDFKNTFANQLYFVPDFDGTLGYYEADPGWAGFGGRYPGDISPDLPVIGGTNKNGKSYMIEQNNDTQPAYYDTQAKVPHNGWGGLLKSFIQAFKEGSSAAGMTTPGLAVGTLWYKTILQDVTCPNEGTSLYNNKPDLFTSGEDQLNWAVFVPEQGYTLRGYSNGILIGTNDLGPGLNYGAFTGVQPGQQRMELALADGNVEMIASGGQCISSECPDCM